MSSAFQAVVFGPSLTGLGNVPFLALRHMEFADMGIKGGVGGFALGLPTSCLSLKNPVYGMLRCVDGFGVCVLVFAAMFIPLVGLCGTWANYEKHY